MGRLCRRIVVRSAAIWCFILLFCAVVPVWAKPLALEAGSALLMDMRSKRVLYEQNSTRKIPPASLTKVMSMFLVLDAVKAGTLSLRTPIRVSRAAARVGGSTMHLRPGERIRLDDLLLGMAVASANDAAAAVAEHVAGSQAAFVNRMNRKAAQLGMKNTVFKTPHGLPAKGQITTAADMLRLACRYLEAHPQARHYHSTPAILHRGMMLQNTNKLLGQDSVSGLKTGFTRASGYNIIFTSKRQGREMIGVLLRAPSGDIRTREAHRLLEYGANIQASMKKKTARAQSSGGMKKAQAAKRFDVAGKHAASSSVKKSGAKQRGTAALPRRVLPQTAGLPPSPQDSQVR